MPTEILDVDKGTLGEKLGIKPGDILVSINCHPINDHLDLAFWGGDFQGEVVWERNSELFSIDLDNFIPQRYGLQLAPIKINHCNNNCVFCFIDQNPAYLRESLYVKDDDYRLSFLDGAYITGTNLSCRDLNRILEMNLSPLYISVHCIDEEIRMKLLGRKKKPEFPVEILLNKLIENNIKVHTQIVIVPRYNDRQVLNHTLDVLLDMGVSSISLVPVGLTVTRNNLPDLEPVTGELAREIITLSDKKRKSREINQGRGLIYPTDNMFLIAGLPVPNNDYYDDYPQLENGVGGIRLFLNELEEIDPVELNQKLLLVTGVSMTPLVKILINKMFVNPDKAEVITVPNTLYGPMVGTAGLLPGKDILQQLKSKSGKVVLIPCRSLNYQQVTIDGYNLNQLSQSSNKHFYIAPSTPDKLKQEIIKIKGLTNE